MGIIRTLRGEDGRPYISLQDLIKEIESVKETSKVNDSINNFSFIDVVLSTLNQMEEQYYEKYIFGKKNLE